MDPSKYKNNPPITIKDPRYEAVRFKIRCLSAILFIALLTLLIIIRLCYLQIMEHKFYSTLSQQNLLYIIPTEPNRGLIYDRNGVLLAKNIPVFSLDIIPGKVKNINKTIKKLKKIITISDKDVEEFKHSLKEHHLFEPVPLKIKLTEQEVAKFYINQYRFPGVSVETRMMRYYPLGPLMSDVLGYVGRINAKELREVNSENYSASDYIGKVGIEKYYEKALHGTIGAEEAEINASGRIVRILKKIPPIPGNTIYLTIDSKLQAYAEKALGNNNGAIVAIQPSTGQILAMVTKPDYDPNAFVQGLSNKAYQALVNAPSHPLYNRAIRGLYSPGSTVKPFIALGALNEHVISPQYTIYDPGTFQLPHTAHIYHDYNWKIGGHGWVNVSKAIMVSCDTFFYNLAVNLGISRLDQILRNFGFGQLTHVDMPEELPGIVPSPAWKLAKQKQPWYTGDTVITGIGQGSLLATPLQLATATSIIAEKGMHLTPHLLLQMTTPTGKSMIQNPVAEKPVILDDPSIWNLVIRAMESVVSNPRGTAEEFGRHPGYSVAAKTGTAQVYGDQRDEEASRMNLPKRLRNNHLFIMFAPVNHPKIALAVVVEHASYADRIARKVTDFYFNELKKVARQ